ncbi:aspartate--tRNA ligase, mitochondrial [Culicoides brevitarsis]|uniref:aspartate--tRNA ligase, mitochondrial n=1 Tax=Culicoides brevitarsis TaxID=469753 RepID=UPI00307BCD11
MNGLLCKVASRRTILSFCRSEGNFGILSLRNNEKYNEKTVSRLLEPASDGFASNMHGINKRQRTSYNMNFFPPPPPPEPLSVKCGDLWEGFLGNFVRLRGRIVKARLGRFLEIRDSRGIAQLVADDENPRILRMFQSIPIDSYITAYGIVRSRLKPNKSIPTGSVELHVEDIRDVDYPMDNETNGVNQRRNYCTSSAAASRTVTSIEFKKINGSKGLLDRLNNRLTTCGELRLADVGKQVTLVGWIDRKKHGKFLHLRDGYGQTQIVIDNENAAIKQSVAALTAESFVLVKGYVVSRPSSNKNTAFETGDIEVLVEHFTVLDPEEAYDGPILPQNQENEAMEVANDNSENGASSQTGESSSVSSSTRSPKAPASPKVNNFTIRTHTCGELGDKDIGKEVTLCGWLEFERMRKFFTLRDGYGCTQIMLPDDTGDKWRIETIPFESILQVTGTVMGRPPGMRNETMATGGIEVILSDLKILNKAKSKLPIEVRDHNRAKEPLRLEYRYIDLRFADMQRNLRTRSKVLMRMREFLINYAGFVEVETPTLFRRTPGGAQEFVVPSQMPGLFYSLVQSPQQLKQMLMVGAIDRYFQIARCYRDEATRPDRQPEFTQLDLELSFSDRGKIMDLIENVLVHCWPEHCGVLNTPFPRLTYEQAMSEYGTDKPDIRFAMKLTDITKAFDNNESLKEGHKNFGASAIVIKSPHSAFPHLLKENLNKMAKQLPKTKFVTSKVVPDVAQWIEGGLVRLLGPEVMKSLAADLHLEPNDLLMFAYGDKEQSQLMMGRVRVATRQNMEIRGIYTPDTSFTLCWVIDFPLFSEGGKEGSLETVHHPFTAPHPDDMHLLETRKDLTKIRSLAYDLVLNGQEIGGGSIRIHDANLQRTILSDLLKLDVTEFNHMLEALRSGCPPHGGIALGIDRLLAIMCNTDSIRDVIAFPKGFEGKDHLSKAPQPLTETEKHLYHIAIHEYDTKTDEKTETNDDDNKSAETNTQQNTTTEESGTTDKLKATS